MKCECIAIVNPCGLLSALPTIEEFCAADFQTDGMWGVRVEVNADDAQMIFQERARVRVLAPGLPPPVQGGDWLYVAVVAGGVRLI